MITILVNVSELSYLPHISRPKIRKIKKSQQYQLNYSEFHKEKKAYNEFYEWREVKGKAKR